MKIEATEKNKRIAAKAVEFLKNRMILNQQILETKFVGENSELADDDIRISLEDFISANQKYIEYCFLNKNLNYKEKESLYEYFRELERYSADFVILSEEQIDEVMGLARKSIETLGLEKVSSCCETSFLRRVLEKLNTDMSKALGADKENCEEYQRLSKWTSFLCASPTVGFNELIYGELLHGEDDSFKILTHDHQLFCNIDSDGEDEVTKPIEEDILIGANLYVGSLWNVNEKDELEESLTILLKKEVNGETLMKEVYPENRIYPTQSKEENREYAVSTCSIKDFFAVNGVGYLFQEVYDQHTFTSVMRAYHNYSQMTEEEKEDIEQVVDFATEWWAAIARHPKNNPEEVRELSTLLTIVNLENKPCSKENATEKFKESLGNAIRIGIMSDPDKPYLLEVDYHPDKVLTSAAKKAQFNVLFPWETNMKISQGKISARVYGSKQNVLYSNEKVQNLHQKFVHVLKLRQDTIGRKND